MTWFGVGWRSVHADAIEAPGATDAVDWFDRLVRLRRDHPLALHGVHLSIAGDAPVDSPYLRDLRDLADALDPAFVSDHLCWTSRGGHLSHDLLPIAYTEEVLAHVAARVDAVQERLGRRLLLENASAYVAFRADAVDEADFFAALCRRTGCGMLLDVNNLYVNAMNLGVDPATYLAAIPADAVGYLHVAGHAVLADVRIDTHDAPVPDAVWDLYARATALFPHAPVILERDDRIPPFAALVEELAIARARHASAHATAPTTAATRSAPAPARWDAVQKEFFERVVDKPLGFDHAGVETLLDDARPVRAARGMRVYSDAYTVGLRRALATNFPTLARALRSDDFDALAAAYLRAHPPRSTAFHELGAALPAFLREHPLAASYAVARDALADVAALEQAQLEAQFTSVATAATALAAEDLAAIPADAWDAARFSFRADLRIVRASHDVLPAVEAGARGDDPPRPHSVASAWLVYRVGAKVRSEPCDPDAAFVLDRLVDGASFGAACEALMTRRDDATEADAAAIAVRAIAAGCERGIVTSVSL
ncbi:MAG: DUF692 family protein [Myxococcota bacterium]|nr:DUF692 family protein [Myxococcota bacterium]